MEPLCFYIPVDIAEGYHLSRYVAAQAQNIYSTAGTTPDMLNAIMDKMIEMCNNTKTLMPTFRTDISLLANQVKYRTKYPVDEDCALRMAAVYLFIDGENPDKVNYSWINKKVTLAKDNPELYTFFLTKGIQFTPAYRELSEALKDEDYLLKRQEAIRALTPLR